MIRLPQVYIRKWRLEGNGGRNIARQLYFGWRQGKGDGSIGTKDLGCESLGYGLFTTIVDFVSDPQFMVPNGSRDASVGPIDDGDSTERHLLVKALAVVGSHTAGNPVLAVAPPARFAEHAEMGIVTDQDFQIVAG